ncbi:hypothetical protein MRX96_057910 [Rhipicephalus microplus]
MDIDRMKRKRAVVRTSTTKLLNDIATMEDDASLGELEEKINLLTLKEDSLKELDREIEIGVEDDALEEEIACSENYKEKINVARTKVQLMLQQYAETANILRSHLYVDDLVTGVDTLEQGKVLCQESSDILSQAGMRLHKWMSNDHDLVNFIEDGNVAKRNANAELPAATKVLGVAEIPGGDAHISRRWKYRSAMAEGFWRRWRREYLLELRSAHLSRPTTSSDLKIDDLVLLKEDHLQRHMWKIARIKETFKGRDGRVRACSLKLSGGTVVKRPIQLLYPLEVDRQ